MQSFGFAIGFALRAPGRGAPVAPPGAIFLIDTDGNLLTDGDGNYLVEAL